MQVETMSRSPKTQKETVKVTLDLAFIQWHNLKREEQRDGSFTFDKSLIGTQSSCIASELLPLLEARDVSGVRERARG